MELSFNGKKVNIAAEFVKIIHASIIFYMTFGWILNNQKVWISIIIFAPLFHLHWKTNDGRCVLTNVEKKLRKDELKEGTFIGGLSKIILKRELSDSAVSKLAYGVMYSSAIICFIKYQLYS